MTTPFPGGPRYDAEWPDVLAGEIDADLRAMTDQPTDPDVMRQAYRWRPFFPLHEPVDGAR